MTPEEKSFMSAVFWVVYDLMHRNRYGTESLDAFRDSYDKAFPVEKPEPTREESLAAIELQRQQVDAVTKEAVREVLERLKIVTKRDYEWEMRKQTPLLESLFEGLVISIDEELEKL